MKFLHSADIHLGAKTDSRFPKDVAEKIKADMRTTFLEMVNYANENDICVILLCGDVFDSDNPFKKDKEFFYGVVKNNPRIDFLYLKGNHDVSGAVEEDIPNLKRFSDTWTVYDYGEVKIGGIEINRDNVSSLSSTLHLRAEDTNVIMMHGQIDGDINLAGLRDKNIDYLALGHLHSYSFGNLDGRGIYVYSGCLSGHGFDETGKKGFVEVEAQGGTVKHKFVPFAKREIIEAEVDVTGVSDYFTAATKVNDEVKLKRSDVYRIELVGETDFDKDDFAEDVERILSGSCMYVSVKDKTRKKADFTVYENDPSLKGEFVRTVLNSDLSDEDKLKVISYGFKALKGERLER